MCSQTFLPVLFLLWSGSAGQVQVQAQSGYNYVRPDLTNTGGVTAGGRLASPGTAPIAYPTAAAATGPDSPATTAYGAGLYPSPAVGYTPSGQATTAFGAPASIPVASTSRRPQPPPPGISSAPRGGPYGPQPSQYGAIARNTGTTTVGEQPDYSDNEGDYSAIPGVPGVDYPIYAQVPRTNFDCSQQALPGYYADIEAQCQVFHICALNRTYSFLCPNGTVFSQETLVCVWWNQYDCISAPNLYANNAYIYDYSERATGGQNYRSGAAAVTAAPTGFIGTQLPTGRNSFASPTPAAVLPSSQSPYGAASVIRPGAANRLTPSNAAVGLLAATAAGVQLPNEQQQQQRTVGGFVQQPQQQLQQSVVQTGNREYLPPANAGQRLRVGGGTTSA
ncbi:uncharacterized protein Dwil_GK10820 [Drosophila willistoni]|uniref:Chitin-binding type-2 domain-containing protein n=1 Tax=Drosophila willistoni TaxID=7260 RepID=B4NAB7_DROWI|nr:uncharacterized protein LOC6647269 [Drosophila willistoni]EDW81804.1 uncharacterized protein Dwil_GK10820 [Drosophila willistoni]